MIYRIIPSLIKLKWPYPFAKRSDINPYTFNFYHIQSNNRVLDESLEVYEVVRNHEKLAEGSLKNFSSAPTFNETK